MGVRESLSGADQQDATYHLGRARTEDPGHSAGVDDFGVLIHLPIPNDKRRPVATNNTGDPLPVLHAGKGSRVQLVSQAAVGIADVVSLGDPFLPHQPIHVGSLDGAGGRQSRPAAIRAVVSTNFMENVEKLPFKKKEKKVRATY
jgi:hypothetical protein